MKKFAYSCALLAFIFSWCRLAEDPMNFDRILFRDNPMALTVSILIATAVYFIAQYRGK